MQVLKLMLEKLSSNNEEQIKHNNAFAGFLKSIIEITSKILTITIIVITLIYSPWLLLIAEFLLSLLFYRPCNPNTIIMKIPAMELLTCV